MKILAVGKNYAQHNKEMGDTLYRQEEPVIFLKPDSSLLKDGKPFFLPDHLGRVDYEGELVVRICRLGKNIPERFAHRYYDAVTVGVDFTARDMQRRLKEQQLPWALSKGFDGAAVIGTWVAIDSLPLVQQLHFTLSRNGEVVQRGDAAEMLFSVDLLISYVSQFCTLKTGDLLYTGTPAGVGPVAVNDHIEGWIEEQKVLEFNVK